MEVFRGKAGGDLVVEGGWGVSLGIGVFISVREGIGVGYGGLLRLELG